MFRRKWAESFGQVRGVLVHFELWFWALRYVIIEKNLYLSDIIALVQ